MIDHSIEMTKDRLQNLLANLKDLTGMDVLVGIPAEKTSRDGQEDSKSITNAQIGYINEFGSPAANIPARPHLIPGIKSKSKQISEILKKGAKAALDGDQGTVVSSLHAAGLLASTAIKKKITDGSFAPLAAATIASRQRRGKTSTKPLIDTGQYRNSITYVVRRKSKANKQKLMTDATKTKINNAWRNTPG